MIRIRVQNLVKKYGATEAVRGVSFEVGEGQIFGLLGPNGAGKTSTVECMIGLRVPDGGGVEICGIDALAHPREVKQRIGAQLQATALQPRITPREALGLFRSFYREGASPGELLRRFSLEEKADASFESLSGGQRQRLALALAFVNEPEVLFLDEPTAGIDPPSRRELHDAIRGMRAQGRTVVLTTHDLEEAQQLCDRVAIIDRGRIVAMGNPDALTGAAGRETTILFRTARPLATETMAALSARPDGDGWRVKANDLSRTLLEITAAIRAEENELIELSTKKGSLEELFLSLVDAGSDS